MTEATAILPSTVTPMPSRTSVAAASPLSNKKTALADAFRTHFSGDAPLADKAKSFAKARPWTSAALLGVAAIGLLGTLRSSRR